jgi:hypothetical protein
MIQSLNFLRLVLCENAKPLKAVDGSRLKRAVAALVELAPFADLRKRAVLPEHQGLSYEDRVSQVVLALDLMEHFYGADAVSRKVNQVWASKNKCAARSIGNVADSCDHCGVVGVKLRKCSACTIARYCGVECQKAAWRESHRKNCGKATHEDLTSGL